MCEPSPNKCKFKNVHINVPVGAVLTQKCCAHVIVEIIKLLSYQRFQIPYNYDHLSRVVGKKREKEKHKIDKESMASKKYFLSASTALDGLETIFKYIRQEFDREAPEEVCIVLGSNIMCAKEVYHIKIPKALNTHFECNHYQESQKTIRKILRTIIFCNDLTNLFSQSITQTNMYILVRRQHNSCNDTSFFVPVDTLKIPHRIHKTMIELDYSPSLDNCCKNLKVFDDLSVNLQNGIKITKTDLENDADSADELLDLVDNYIWYRGKTFLKGFKAVFVNGESLSNTWIS